MGFLTSISKGANCLLKEPILQQPYKEYLQFLGLRTKTCWILSLHQWGDGHWQTYDSLWCFSIDEQFNWYHYRVPGRHFHHWLPICPACFSKRSKLLWIVALYDWQLASVPSFENYGARVLTSGYHSELICLGLDGKLHQHFIRYHEGWRLQPR